MTFKDQPCDVFFPPQYSRFRVLQWTQLEMSYRLAVIGRLRPLCVSSSDWFTDAGRHVSATEIMKRPLNGPLSPGKSPVLE